MSSYIKFICFFGGLILTLSTSAQKIAFLVTVNNVSGEINRFDSIPQTAQPIATAIYGNNVSKRLIITHNKNGKIEFTDTYAYFQYEPGFPRTSKLSSIKTTDELWGFEVRSSWQAIFICYDKLAKKTFYIEMNLGDEKINQQLELNDIKTIEKESMDYCEQKHEYYFISTDTNNSKHLYTINSQTATIKAKTLLNLVNSNNTLKGIEFFKFTNKIYGIEKDVATARAYFVSLDAQNGTINRINMLPNVDSFMHSGIIHERDSKYIFVGKDINGQTKLYTIEINTGLIKHQPNFYEGMPSQNGEHVVGLQYNSVTNSIVAASWQNINNWKRYIMYNAFIPNAFTPNHYGPIRNNKFYVQCDECEYYKIQIVNRKGTLIFDGNKNQPWDGHFRGELVQNDVYWYKITTLDINGFEHTYHGNVTLIW